MQRTELAARVPEATRQLIDLPQLTLIGIRRCARAREHAVTPVEMRSAQRRASALSSCSSNVSKCPLLTAARPEIHTSLTWSREAPKTLASADRRGDCLFWLVFLLLSWFVAFP